MNIIDSFLKQSHLTERVKEIDIENTTVLVQTKGIDEGKAQRKIKKYIMKRWDKILSKIEGEMREKTNKWEDSYGIEVHLSKEKFISNLKPVLIEVYDDGSSCILFDANNMFADRKIEVKISKYGKIESIGLADLEE